MTAFTPKELEEINLLLDDALIRAGEMLYNAKKDLPYYEAIVEKLRVYLGIKEAEE